MEKKTDRRVIRTKSAIKTAFLQLLEKKDFAEITVKELAAKADVDRKTIYNYYNSTYEILDEFTEDCVKVINSEFDKHRENKDTANTILDLYKFFSKVIENNIDIYSIIVKIKDRCNLAQRLVCHLTLKIKEDLEKMDIDKDLNLDIVAEFIADGILGVYRRWFYSDKSVPISELSNNIKIVLLNGLNALKAN